ncbi:hypothetical protein HMPREF1002_04429 [Porphyromonas sp. 31_2]|nr:hypothetical protein HMPREF1002_04429 [Porphyromonas sp. 31_2]
MKFALHTSTAISSVLKVPEHFYVDIYYLIILIIVTFALLLLSFYVITFIRQKGERTERNSESCG